MKEPAVDASEIVKRVRALSGLTRKEVAELAEVSPSTIGRIEQGTLDPTWGMLCRILDATGFRISDDAVVSAGDATAIAAARPLLESVFVGAGADMAANDSETSSTEQWIARWSRAGWLSDEADPEDWVRLAVSAGNAAKIARRNVDRRVVSVDGGWRALARRLDEAGVSYAVSGLLATRVDRATANSVSPVIYVERPSQLVKDLRLTETTAGRGVLLIAPTGNELTDTETDYGIHFVSRAQGVLDAFAGSGREPDKAEDTLRQLLAAAVRSPITSAVRAGFNAPPVSDSAR